MMSRSPRKARTLARAATAVAFAAAVVGWTSNLTRADSPAPSIRIADVRPLMTSDPALRNLITHTFEVRVEISGWRLLPYLPAAPASDNWLRAGHWRLYVDGSSLGDNYGSSLVSYTTYLTPGMHWIAAELTNEDGTHPVPPVWSEPALLHVPRVVRCWQTGWQGSRETRTPSFNCSRATRRSARAAS